MPIVVAPSLNVTMPVPGNPAWTMSNTALKVTGCPYTEGLAGEDDTAYGMVILLTVWVAEDELLRL